MELQYKKREKIVGFFIIFVVFLLLATVALIGRGKDWFKTYVTYYTYFNEGYNLQVNAAVKLSKADIGKVKRVMLAEDKVKVELAILEEYTSRIKIDSVATVESPTLIGDEYVSIKPGYKDSPLVRKGGIIPSKSKKAMLDFWDELQVEKLSKMIVQTIQNLSEISRKLNDPDGPLFGSMNNLNAITQNVKSGDGSLGQLITTKTAINQISSILSNLETATAKAPQTVEKVNQNLDEFSQMIKQFEESIQILKTALENIEKGSLDVPDIATKTRKGIAEMRDTVDDMDKVIQSVQKNFLIRKNLPDEPEIKNIDAGLRE